MNGFWIVFRRELAGRSLLLVVSAAMGLFLALLPWISFSKVTRPDELRGAAAVAAAVLWGLTLAVALGATAVGSRLADRRLAFDYRLPAGDLAIWLGRLVAGLAMVLGGVALLLLVPLPFGLDLEGGAGALDQLVESAVAGPQGHANLLVLLPLVLTLLFLLAHGAAVALAGARAWIALELAAVLLAKGAVWIAWRELGFWIADAARVRLLASALALAVGGLVAASVVAARQGRSEPDRAHRALALGTALAMVLVAGFGPLYTRWFLTPELEDLLEDARHERQLDARWSLSQGRASGRDDVLFTFLRQLANGRELRLGPLPSHLAGWAAVELSADGSTIAWTERTAPYQDASEFWTLDARDPRAQPVRRALVSPQPAFSWALAPDGSEVASLRAGRNGAHLDRERLADGLLTAIVPLPVCRWADGPVRYTAGSLVELVCTPRDPRLADEAHPQRRFAVDLSTQTIADLGPTRLRAGGVWRP